MLSYSHLLMIISILYIFATFIIDFYPHEYFITF